MDSDLYPGDISLFFFAVCALVFWYFFAHLHFIVFIFRSAEVSVLLPFNFIFFSGKLVLVTLVLLVPVKLVSVSAQSS